MLRNLATFLKLAVSLLLIVPMLALLLPIWLFVKMCFGVNRLLVSSGTGMDKIIHFEPVIGWKPTAALKDVTYFDVSGDKASITTGNDGWPGDYSIEESDVVVFGDSFAFGYGSEYKNTYYGLPGDIRIKPVAASGYSMVQALILMKKYREKLNGKLVVWLICLENDLAENIQPNNSMFYRTPFVKKHNVTGKWEIVTSHVSEDKWLFGSESNNTLKFATICTPSAYTDKVMSGCRFLIREAKDICDSTGAKLLVFTIPDKKQLTEEGNQHFRSRLNKDAEYDENLPDKRLSEICKEFDISFQAGMELLDSGDYKSRDTHWNKRGNRKISDFMREFYKKA